MNFSEYQNLSQRTAGHLNGGDPKLNLAISTLGLVGESGAVAELIKKHTGHGREIDIEKVSEKLGDALWHLCDVASQLGIDLDNMANFNIEKLNARYPDGFSYEASLNRPDRIQN